MNMRFWKTVLEVVIVFLVTTSLAQNRDVEQQVRNSLEQVQQAIRQHDASALGRLYGDDLTVQYADGSTADKAARIKAATSATATGFDASDVKIRLYGTAAVVTGVASYKNALSARFTQVWVKREGRWQEVALSIVTIKSEAASR